MRRLKHKHTRRAVRFFKIQYGFRSPFKVVLDGNFLHALQLASLGDPKQVLIKLLGAPSKPLVTACVLHELKTLGKDFRGKWKYVDCSPTGTFKFARQACATHDCGHGEEHLAASSCLLACSGEGNPQHFFVATQDVELRTSISRAPGGAVIFMSGNGVHLEAPSQLQQQLAAQEDMQQDQPSVAELKSAALKDLPLLQRPAKERNLFRRNRAKAPNPLAVRKKQSKPSAAESASQEGQHRKRRRRKGKQDAVSQGASEEDAHSKA